MNNHPIRLCNGGPHAVAFCGRAAVVVCTERTDALHPLQWYACDIVEHREGAYTQPIEEWFKALFNLENR